jgi:hypothetical protein
MGCCAGGRSENNRSSEGSIGGQSVGSFSARPVARRVKAMIQSEFLTLPRTDVSQRS